MCIFVKIDAVLNMVILTVADYQCPRGASSRKRWRSQRGGGDQAGRNLKRNLGCRSLEWNQSGRGY